MGDSAVDANASARITGDGTLGTSGDGKGKKYFNGNEVSWSFTTNNTESSHWLMDALQINGTDINVPYGESGPVSKTTLLPSGAVVTVTLNSVTGSGSNAKRKYTIAVSNVYEDVVISGGNIYNADISTEIITEVLTNVEYQFCGYASSDSAYENYQSGPSWINWGEGEPIAVGENYSGRHGNQNIRNYYMYGFDQTNNNAMRFRILPGYINPELAYVTSTEGDLHNNVTLGSGLSFGSMPDNNGKYYPINGNPSDGYYYFRITGIGDNNKLALLRIRATLGVYDVAYNTGNYNGTSIVPETGTLPDYDDGDYNVKTKPEIVLSGSIPIDSSNKYTFTHWTIDGAPDSQHYAPGQVLQVADVYQYAKKDGNGNLYIPLTAHWATKEEAEQVNYKIEFWIEGQATAEFTYNMQAPKDSAIYVNRDSEHIANVLEVYEGLLEYDEEHSAQYVDKVEEGSVIKLQFKWIRYPVTIEKVVESVSAADRNKEYSFTASASRDYQIHVYDPVTGTINQAQNVSRSDSMKFEDFKLKDKGTNILQEKGLDVTKGSTIHLNENNGKGFSTSYRVTTYKEDGTTVKEEKIVTKQELDALKIEEKTKITVINARGKVNVKKTVRAGNDGTIKQEDIDTTIYFALKKQGESDFVKDEYGNIYVQAIHVTKGIADATHVTFVGIEDGIYDVWECSDANGSKLNVGDNFTANGKTFQLSRIQGQSAAGNNNDATVAGNGTAEVSFINTYTDVNENISFVAKKEWYQADGSTLMNPKPVGTNVGFTLYQEENGSDIEVKTITLDGIADENGETEAWVATFKDLPKLDAEGKAIVYKVKETSVPTGYELVTTGFMENNGGTIYNRQVAIPVSIWKTDESHKALTGAKFVLYNAADYDDNSGQPKADAQPIVQDTFVDQQGLLNLGYLPYGSYRLVETKAPDGYNLAETAIKITVGSNGVTAIQGTAEAEVAQKDSSNKYSQYWISGQDDATWQIRVWNNPGVELPSTGGSGTRVLYLLGAILITLAGVGLVMKKRHRNVM